MSKINYMGTLEFKNLEKGDRNFGQPSQYLVRKFNLTNPFDVLQDAKGSGVVICFHMETKSAFWVDFDVVKSGEISFENLFFKLRVFDKGMLVESLGRPTDEYSLAQEVLYDHARHFKLLSAKKMESLDPQDFYNFVEDGFNPKHINANKKEADAVKKEWERIFDSYWWLDGEMYHKGDGDSREIIFWSKNASLWDYFFEKSAKEIVDDLDQRQLNTLAEIAEDHYMELMI